MYNNTKKSWVLSREIQDWRYGSIYEQNKILAQKSRDEGLTVIGFSAIKEPVENAASAKKIQSLIDTAKEKQIDALFVFSLRHISEVLDDALRFVDMMNRNGIVVYDANGYRYSYDWVCKQIGKRFRTQRIIYGRKER